MQRTLRRFFREVFGYEADPALLADAPPGTPPLPWSNYFVASPDLWEEIARFDLRGVGLVGRDLSSHNKRRGGLPRDLRRLAAEGNIGEGARRAGVPVLSGAALDELEPVSGRLPPVLVLCVGAAERHLLSRADGLGVRPRRRGLRLPKALGGAVVGVGGLLFRRSSARSTRGSSGAGRNARLLLVSYSR